MGLRLARLHGRARGACRCGRPWSNSSVSRAPRPGMACRRWSGQQDRTCDFRLPKRRSTRLSYTPFRHRLPATACLGQRYKGVDTRSREARQERGREKPEGRPQAAECSRHQGPCRPNHRVPIERATSVRRRAGAEIEKEPPMIVVDWGTSSFRAYRSPTTGGFSIAAARPGASSPSKPAAFRRRSMPNIGGGSTASPATSCSAAWSAAAGLGRGALCGLPGRSRCPSRPPPRRCLGRQRVFIAPGVAARDASGVPDVMRGEEVQILGIARRWTGRGRRFACPAPIRVGWSSTAASRDSAPS